MKPMIAVLLLALTLVGCNTAGDRPGSGEGWRIDRKAPSSQRRFNTPGAANFRCS
jgi:hypothetical protein